MIILFFFIIFASVIKKSAHDETISQKNVYLCIVS